MAKPKAKAKTRPAAGASLATARDAIRDGRHGDALAPLLVAWRDKPSAKLASIIMAISDRVKVELPAVRGKTAAATRAWTARAAKATLTERPALLASLADGNSAAASERLATIAKWMPDPRVDDAILTLIEVVPYRASSTRPFWTTLWPLAEQLTDPSQLARLERADAAGVAVTMRGWLRARFARLLEAVHGRLAGPHDEPAILDEISNLLASRKLSIRTQNLEALLQAVYDAPADDAPRLVYADALLERGDPRGELITAQIRLATSYAIADRELRQREKELVTAHGKQWLGELAPVVMSGYRFERGFLAECRVDNRHIDRVRKLVGHPAWSTVHTIAGSALIALHPIMRSLRSLAFVSYEARNHENLPDSWRDLLLDTERAIEALHYKGIEADRHWEDALENNQSIRPGVQGRWVNLPSATELAALCECRALPKLRHLTVAERPELVAAALFASPVIRRLETLGIEFESTNMRAPMEHFTDALRDAPVPVLELQLGPDFHPTKLRLERGSRGYARLAMHLGPTSRSNWSTTLVNEAIGILDAMPPSLREVRITARRQTEPTQVSRLRAAAAQMKLDLFEVT